MDDHDLLMRIDERMRSVQDDLSSMRRDVHDSQQAIIVLRLEAAKWGGIAGMIGAVVIMLIGVAIKALQGL